MKMQEQILHSPLPHQPPAPQPAPQTAPAPAAPAATAQGPFAVQAQLLARRSIDALIDRLSVMGYRIDREKWSRLHAAGLIGYPGGEDRVRQAVTARLRHILEIERRLAP